MRIFRLSAYYATLGLIVWLASSTAFARSALEGNEMETARAEIYRANLLTPDEELVVGRRLAYLYSQRHEQLNDPAAQSRLDRVRARLATVIKAQTPDITIIKSPLAEAISFPPSRIFITSALLELTVSDDELAAVIAHEAAHMAQHHLARLIGLALTLDPRERENFPTRSEIIKGYATHFTFPSALDGTRLRYEMEADQLATCLLECAGYRAAALSTLLDKLASLISAQAQPERAALRARVRSLLAPDSLARTLKRE